MDNRRFVSGSDVPELSGNTERDLQELRDYLVMLANELQYRLGRLEGAAAQVEN